jgi:hypothetical protein
VVLPSSSLALTAEVPRISLPRRWVNRAIGACHVLAWSTEPCYLWYRCVMGAGLGYSKDATRLLGTEREGTG